MPGRLQTATDRELASDRARREREAAPACEADDAVTGKYEGPELDEKRAEREPEERIARLEKKHDALVLEVRTGYAGMNAKLDTIIELAGAAQAERENKAERDARIALAKHKSLPAIIKAVGIAIALVIAALLGRGTIP